MLQVEQLLGQRAAAVRDADLAGKFGRNEHSVVTAATEGLRSLWRSKPSGGASPRPWALLVLAEICGDIGRLLVR